MPKVSVCIPIYNAERDIKTCARSLFEQTLDDVEYIFVDDGSTDQSVSILKSVLEDYPQQKIKCTLIVHSSNLGVSATRKDAVNASRGDYIIHCDADDWVEPDIYELLYHKAVSNKADMAYCSFIRESGKKAIVHTELDYSPVDMIKAFFWGYSHASLWNKLWKRSLYLQANCPAEITMCEDQRLNIQMLLHARRIVNCSQPLYHYRENSKSITFYGRNYKNIQSEIANISFYDLLLDEKEYGRALDCYKQRLLLEGLMLGSISAQQWHSLWKPAKRAMWTSSYYPWKLKALFFFACINYKFANYLWLQLKKKPCTSNYSKSVEE